MTFQFGIFFSSQVTFGTRNERFDTFAYLQLAKGAVIHYGREVAGREGRNFQ